MNLEEVVCTFALKEQGPFLVSTKSIDLSQKLTTVSKPRQTGETQKRGWRTGTTPAIYLA
jgi:hypothetical protein